MTEAEAYAQADRQVAAALRERNEARAEADKLRRSHARLFEALSLYDCDYGCGCFKRHCSEELPCLAHKLDEARVEVAKRDLTIIDLRDRLTLLEKERDAAGLARLLGQMDSIVESTADVARRQREACVAAVLAYHLWNGSLDVLADEVRATQLVTEETS